MLVDSLFLSAFAAAAFLCALVELKLDVWCLVCSLVTGKSSGFIRSRLFMLISEKLNLSFFEPPYDDDDDADDDFSSGSKFLGSGVVVVVVALADCWLPTPLLPRPLVGNEKRAAKPDAKLGISDCVKSFMILSGLPLLIELKSSTAAIRLLRSVFVVLADADKSLLLFTFSLSRLAPSSLNGFN